MKQGNDDQSDSTRFKKRRSFADASTTKQKKLIKIKNSILIKKWIQFSNEEDLLTALVDSEIKINLVNQIYVIQWELQSVNADLSLSRFLNDQSRYCYGAYELIYNIIDFWEQHKKCITLFYEINFEGSNIIFDMSMLTNQNIIIHSTTSSWRFEIDIKKFELFEFKEFVKDLKRQVNIYALVVVDVITTIKKFKPSKISKDYLYLKKLFDNEKTKVLSEQNQKDHAIDLMKNTKPLYMLLYNLSQKELAEFRRYLNDVLNKNWIKFSMSFVDVPILFVFKKGEGLRLCVNYKSLNAIIIKNRHFLSLITKTLNRLYEVKRFTKLNLSEAGIEQVIWV